MENSKVTALPPRPTDPIELCRYEQALALAYEGPGAWGALQGYADNAVEQAIIEEGFVVPAKKVAIATW